jgi:lysine decarboxylase
VCHDWGVPLLVDQAWGPHFPFHGSLPPHALSVGADMVVTGCHKLLGAFTQASMLHVRGRLVDPGHVDVVRRLLETTSPSCLLYASLDVARMQMATEGELALQEAIELAEEARFRLGSHPLLRCLDKTLVGSYGVAALDPTRLCVDVSRTGHTGYQVERMLRAEGVVVEMSDFTNVLANITIAHRWDQVDALVQGLVAIAEDATGPPPGRGGAGAVLPAQPEAAMSPAEAFHAPQQRIPLGDAAGRVAAELAASYPPGIPVVGPGERLTRPLVDYLAAQVRAGCRMVGPEDPTLGTINVVR